MAVPATVVPTTLTFFDNVYSQTEYEDKADADAIFSAMRDDLPRVATSPEGSKLIIKFVALSRTVTAEGPLKDMVKIIWRMVKPMSGSAPYKLCLFYLSVGTVLDYLKISHLRGVSGPWVEGVERWLGKQLTIGGKGVTGEGEGSVEDRLKRFFSTPYLHDFDWVSYCYISVKVFHSLNL